MRSRMFGIAAILAAVVAVAPVRARAQGGYNSSFMLRPYGPVLDIGYGSPLLAFGQGGAPMGYIMQTMSPAAAYWLQQQALQQQLMEQQLAQQAQQNTATPGEAAATAQDALRRVPIARNSDVIDARIEKDGRLLIRWHGDPTTVTGITFALLDKDRKPIKTTILNRLPAEARFTMTNRTAYYRVVVEYVNGTTNTVVSPI